MSRWTCICLAVCSVAGLVSADDGQWKKHSSEAGKFSIEFPDKAMERPNDSGYELRRGTESFYLDWRKTAAISLDKKDAIAKVFDQLVQNLGETFKGKRLSREDITIQNKYPGCDASFEVPAIGVYRVRLIYTGERFYQVVVSGPKEFVEGKDAKRFLGSLKITQ